MSSEEEKFSYESRKQSCRVAKSQWCSRGKYCLLQANIVVLVNMSYLLFLHTSFVHSLQAGVQPT